MSLWIFETMLATTLLMLIVLAIREPVARHFGARTAYLLWLAPALRMIMPALPEGWGIASGQQIQDAVIIMAGVSAPAGITVAASDGDTLWPIALGAVWLGGAALFFTQHMLNYRRFVRTTIKETKPFEVRDAITISASPHVSSPLAFGIIGKTIIIPHDFSTRFDATEQRLALAHELTHHRRGDPGINFFALMLLALHWFNPIAHIAHRAFRLDQEAACDAIVLNGATACERHAYGSALFKAAIGPVPLAACAMGTVTTLKTRLKWIAAHPQPKFLAQIGWLAAAAFVICGVLLTASNGFAAKKVEESAVNPQAMILGGGIIDIESASTERAIAEAETALKNAERDAAAAFDAADKASDAALESARDQAKAEVARAKADLASASAKVARATADAIRAEVKAKMALPAIPEPAGAPPAPEGEAAPTPPAPPIASIASKTRCPEELDRQEVKTVHRGPGGKIQNFSMIICLPSQKGIRKNMVEGLKAARATIAAEMHLAEEQRRRALEALDSRISSLESSRPTLQ
jgi:bla regulator protein blaR1